MVGNCSVVSKEVDDDDDEIKKKLRNIQFKLFWKSMTGVRCGTVGDCVCVCACQS